MISEIWWLDAWTDEMTPAGPDLASWAKWLAEPDADWGRAAGAECGSCFDASRMVLFADVRLTWNGQHWEIEGDAPADADFFAIRYGEGMGWGPEEIVSSVENAIETLNQDPTRLIGDTHFIAVGRHDPRNYTVQFYRAENRMPVLEVLPEKARAH